MTARLWVLGHGKAGVKSLDSERIEPFVDIATLFAEKWHQ
jgi:hypothetical protein